MSAAACTVCFAGSLAAQAVADPLKAGFENPPNSARPLVWWHWMNGNISKEGIKLDLEWMHRVGIAGYQNFDAAMATPQVVDKRLAYMTPEWKDAFRYAIALGDQFGMSMAIAGSPGWSESGGPWVPPSHGMKKYVWSETLVQGGHPFTGKLSHPPKNTGAFQNMGIHDELGSPSKVTAQFYADAAVVAFRTPSNITAHAVQPRITSSDPALEPALLSDGDVERSTSLAIAPAGETSWILFDYGAPTTIRAVTYVTADPGGFAAMLTGATPPERTLESSNDGKNFTRVIALPGGSAPEHTLAFRPVTARYFRVVFKTVPPPPKPPFLEDLDPASLGFNLPPKSTSYQIAELTLHHDPRVDHFEEKAAFAPEGDLYRFVTPEIDPALAIRKPEVLDLTSKMREDGTLDWTPPDGDWVVLRLGYSLMGITNHPATPEATGLEVDKLDRRFVKDYFEKYLDSYKETVGAAEMGAHGIRNVVNDSWEAGSQNWTDNMLAQFEALRGYDPTPFLPVLAGHIVESSASSDRFLWDFRKTIADLVANEHYGQLEQTLHERGMGHYGESHESGRALVADGMEVKKFNEVPMSAMWTTPMGSNKVQFGYNADDRESASVAHIYGQNIAAAESMTTAESPWAWSPATLKATADQELLNGINRIVIHESTHQPLVDKAPGLTLGPFGQWFNRNETWAEQARPWIDYLARSSYLLQQGHFGADLIYFYGEDTNLTALFDQSSPNLPAGYAFDYVNADGLIHELNVVDHRIITKSGMQYRVLGLDPYSRHMSLPVLRAIYSLVRKGAIVAGPKPMDDPSLADDRAAFEKLSSVLFGDGSGIHHVGQGTVHAGATLADVMTAIPLAPDFDYQRVANGPDLQFVHRKLAVGDIYFVDNRSDQPSVVDATFRLAGRVPELWHPEDGSIEPASYKIAQGRTTVPLRLEAWGTTFVVFRKSTSKLAEAVPPVTETKLAEVTGPWTIHFQSGRGAPDSITLDRLSDWSQNTDPRVKYFSGAGAYIKNIQAAPEWFRKGARLWIDLGDVKNLAIVEVNGKNIGEVWHPPYRIDVTSALKPGENQITVTVVNSWVNRLIGDQQPGATKFTFADVKPYKANSPPLPSGLIGPVTLIRRDNAARP